MTAIATICNDMEVWSEKINIMVDILNMIYVMIIKNPVITRKIGNVNEKMAAAICRVINKITFIVEKHTLRTLCTTVQIMSI